jgi:hypothetical protein
VRYCFSYDSAIARPDQVHVMQHRVNPFPAGRARQRRIATRPVARAPGFAAVVALAAVRIAPALALRA